MAKTIDERLAEAEKKRDAARLLVSDADRVEIEKRAKIAKAEEEEREAGADKRALDLLRRFEILADKFGADTLRAVAVKGFPDTFIVQRDGTAHGAWEKGTVDAGTNKKIDRADIARKYARDSIIDWNGRDLDDSTVTHELEAFLKKNPGVVTPITNAAAELNGVFAEERKSTG